MDGWGDATLFTSTSHGWAPTPRTATLFSPLVALTPNTCLAYSGMVTAWDTETQMMLKRYQPRTGAADMNMVPNCLVCDEVGENLAAGYNDGKARLWAIQGGRLLRTFTATTFGGVTAVCTIAGVGATVAATVCTGSEDGLVKQFDIGSGDLLHTIAMGASVVGLWGQGAKLWVGGATGKVSQYNLVTGSKSLSYEGVKGVSCVMRMHAPSSVIVAGTPEGKIHTWDITSGESIGVTIAHHGAVVSLGVDRLGYLWSAGGREACRRGEKMIPTPRNSPQTPQSPAPDPFTSRLAQADAKQVKSRPLSLAFHLPLSPFDL